MNKKSHGSGFRRIGASGLHEPYLSGPTERITPSHPELTDSNRPRRSRGVNASAMMSSCRTASIPSRAAPACRRLTNTGRSALLPDAPYYSQQVRALVTKSRQWTHQGANVRQRTGEVDESRGDLR